MSTFPDVQSPGTLVEPGRFRAISERLRYPLAVYLASRVLYLLVAVADVFIRNGRLGLELRNWDGKWYTLLAQYGYPHHIATTYGNRPGGYSTLGFEPLYSMLMWVGGLFSPRGIEPAGLLISLVCGGIATVEISVLAERWWGADASRRGVLFFCFFPGTIVFSMVYPEGLSLALIAGALLCLEDRRWIAAGLLAGAATAVEPVALAIVPACGLVSLRELWRHGWRDRDARRSLLAPVLSVWGVAGTGIFMWFWVGTPLAVDKTQRIAWGEKSSPYAVYYQARNFFKNEIFSWHGWSNVNLNLPVGFIGALFLLWGLRRLWKLRRGLPIGTSTASTEFADRTVNGVSLQGVGVSLAAVVYTAFVAILAMTSDNTPPNPRMLICAFPVLMAVAAPFSGRKQKILLGITLVLLVAMSIGTFEGGGLRP
jgi:hypothetical protein